MKDNTNQKGPSVEAKMNFYKYALRYIIPRISEEEKQRIIDMERAKLLMRDESNE